jgi:predicted nucleic acid-binding protein
MKVVCNTTPILSLSAIHKLSLLNDLFRKFYIPTVVYQEIKAKNGVGFTDIDHVDVEIVSIQNTAYLQLLCNELDEGEAQAIVLAKELNVDILIIDERLGYKIAQSQQIYVIGTLTVLEIAKKKKLIDKVSPLLDELIHQGRWYSQNVKETFLKKIGE